MSFPLLTIITFVPLLGAVVVLLLPKNNERLIKQWAVAISIVPLLLSIYLWFAYNQTSGGYQFAEQIPWIPQLGASYHMGVDGLSVPLIFLTTLLTTLGLWYSMRVIKVRVREFFLLFLLLEMGMLGVFVALDFVLFYVFWEIGLVPMYFLIAIWGQPGPVPSTPPSSSSSTRWLDQWRCCWPSWASTSPPARSTSCAAELKPFANDIVLGSLAFWAFFLAFAIKVPSFPFHTWLPDAHTAAPTAGSVILAGVLLKLGAYGFLRIVLPTFPNAFKQWASSSWPWA